MTTLTKLGIQGIRSFSSDRMESLEFERPVTLIVGHNGAGKTTVIECLKMATCGQLPPNCDKGHGFVHDPNVAGLPEVKGQVRLLFRTGVNHEHVCATRTFQLTNTRGKNGVVKSTFKALENLLRVKDKDGANSSNTRRCADMDMIVPELMGVSRPILDHVIFCHQEDSNWPLGERILLKKRFDEIFGSSRYTKALEAIDKKRKEVAKDAKDKSHVLDLIRKDREVAEQLRAESTRLEQCLREMDREVRDAAVQISKEESVLGELSDIESTSRVALDKMDMLKKELMDVGMQDGMDGMDVSEIDTLSNRRGELVSRISALKPQFQQSLCLRNETSAKLRFMRKTAMEDSNVSGLIELKSKELRECVAAGNAKFLCDDMQTFLRQKVAERESLMSTHISRMREIDGQQMTLQPTLNQLVKQQAQIEAEGGQWSDRRSKAQFEIERIESALKQTPSVEQVKRRVSELDHSIESMRVSRLASGSQGGLVLAKKMLLKLVGVPSEEELERKISILRNNEDKTATDSWWNAKTALKIYSTLKSKSADSAMCQFCKGAISDIPKFETGINKYLEKLPGLVEEFQRKMDGGGSATELARLEIVSEFCRQVDGQNNSLSLANEGADESGLVNERDSLRAQIHSVERMVSEREGFISLVSESTANLQGIEISGSQIAIQIETVSDQLAALAVAKQRQVESHGHDLPVLDALLAQLSATVEVTNQLSGQLEQLKGRVKRDGGTVGSSQSELSKLEQTEADLNNETGRLMGELNEAESELEQVVKKLTHLESVRRRSELQCELSKLQSAVVNCPPDIRDKIRQSTLRLQGLRDVRSRLSGQLTQIKVQADEVQTKLAKFIDIDEKFKTELIQSETLNLVAKDIAHYHQALDRALMQYHVSKMNQINHQLKDLWERVYKGTDIDFIAIRSDTEQESENGEVMVATTSVVSSSARGGRSYNYRVVMAKNDVELEMRGRCSAGQKVLASLIIRLVLAESFSVNCGILALDEPTTNLDRANISGLAEALAELIESRREEKNFQLIIITHDESFVRMLGRLHACDAFYRVAKDHGGHSTISRAAIYELNA